MADPDDQRDYWAVHRAARAAERFGQVARHHLDHPRPAMLEAVERDLSDALEALAPPRREARWKGWIYGFYAIGFWLLILVQAAAMLGLTK